MVGRPEEENLALNCHVCGSEIVPTTTDLPFKVGETTIVIVKSLPVLQCRNRGEYLLEDAVMERVDEILRSVNGRTELEIVRYAA